MSIRGACLARSVFVASHLGLHPAIHLLAPTPPIFATPKRLKSSKMSLQDSKVIPDVIDNVSPSRAALDISFQETKVSNGIHLPPSKAASAPTISIHGTDPGELYTLLCTDPDPPDPAAPKFREWLHWMVVNIPGGGEVGAGTEVVPYRGPAPPIGTHRYVFTLFKQPNQSPIQAKDPSHGDPGKRGKFNTSAFAKEHNLGDAVSAAYFLSHKD